MSRPSRRVGDVIVFARIAGLVGDSIRERAAPAFQIGALQSRAAITEIESAITSASL